MSGNASARHVLPIHDMRFAKRGPSYEMANITLDTSALEKRITRMIYRIQHVKRVEVGQVLSDWQVDDMHRHRPGTKRNRGMGTASTIVRPHSLREMQRSRKFGQTMGRIIRSKRRKNKVVPRTYLRTSTRPILRAELFEKLKERVHALVARIHW